MKTNHRRLVANRQRAPYRRRPAQLKVCASSNRRTLTKRALLVDPDRALYPQYNRELADPWDWD